ncbi:AAA family ATPase [Streptomyces sp. NPDC006668]|uniref:helix-turn-helix transcriptional regulator n=1 Tax=Streptomyces sp. NPDC006668 TaxID=3156903 RepID=UPI0033CAFFAF
MFANAPSDADALHPTLFGRSRELGILSKSIRGSAGHYLTVLLGAPGSGKSALLAAARVQAAHDGVSVLHTRRREPSLSDSYSTIRDLFHPLRLADSDPQRPPLFDHRARTALARLASGSIGARRFNGSAEQQTSDVAAIDDYRMLDGLRRVVTQLAAQRPVALMVDDAHWSDAVSLDWLSFLARRAATQRFHVMVTFCDLNLTGRRELTELLRIPGTQLIRLNPLGTDDVAQAVEDALGRPADEQFTRSCAEVTGGNPRFLRLLLNAIAAEGLKPHRNATGRVRQVGYDIIASSMSRYFDRFPPHVRAMTLALAVLDRYPRLHPEPRALSEESCELIGQLVGVSAHLVTEVMDRFREHDQFFLKTLPAVSRAMLHSLPEDQRIRLREQAARLLLDSGHPVDSAARQLLQVDRHNEEWMTTALLVAAKEAELRGENDSAVKYLKHALDGSPSRQLCVNTELALAGLLTPKDPQTAMDHLSQVMVRTDDVRIRAVAATLYGLTAISAGQAPLALSSVEQALAALKASAGPVPSAADHGLLRNLEWTLLTMGADHPILLTQTLAKPVHPDLHSQTPVERQILATHAFLTGLRGGPATEVRDYVDRATNVRDTETPFWTVTHIVLALLMVDEPGRALMSLRTPMALGPAPSGQWDSAAAAGLRALAHYTAGDLPLALDEVRLVTDRTENTGEDHRYALLRITQASVLIEQNAPQQAEVLLNDTVVNEDSFVQLSLLLLTRAKAKGGQGDLHSAFALVQRCRRIMECAGVADPALVPWRPYAVSLLLRLERAQEAAKLAEEGLAQAQLRNTPRVLGTALTSWAAVTDGTRRTDFLRQALLAFKDSSARLQHARTAYLLGTTLLRKGDTAEACELLRSAGNLAWSCGARPLARSADHALATAAPPPPTTSGVCKLTTSEFRVAALAARGATNREISDVLFVSVHTVEGHLTSVYRKLGTSNRSALPAALASLGTDR